jgi:thiol-disulfide isomerase/thioredoxin
MDFNIIEKIEQANQKIISNKALLIYFYNDNCVPCLSLRPKVIALFADSFPEMKLYFVDSVKNSEIAAHYNSFSNPTLIIFFEGKEHRRFSKFISIHQLAEEIRKPYSIIFE